MSDELVERLRRGPAGDDAALRVRLGVDGPVDDAALGRALVAAVAAAPLALRSEAGAASEARAEPEPAATDVRSLLALACAGTLAERRRSLLRLASLLGGDLPEEDVAEIDEALARARDLDAGYELLVARRALPGAASAEVRAEDAAARALAGRLEVAIGQYWDGQLEGEPLAALAPEELASVALRLREWPAAIAGHVAALVEGTVLDAERRRAWLDAFRHAGDPRLVPALVTVLGAETRPLVRSAARALARIEDPRVKPALLRAYRRSAQPDERAALAGALGLLGEPAGRAWVRALLSSTETAILEVALGAMATLGLPEDVDRIAPLLAHPSPEVRLRAVRALGRTGDGRALERLRQIGGEGEGALQAEVDEAERVIAARLELRGEAPPAERSRGALATGPRTALGEAGGVGFSARLRAFADWLAGRAWLALGARDRAARCLERAAARHPAWAAPLVALAEGFGPDESAHALTALRRAVERDRAWVERHGARALARVFLRRADESEKAGRSEVARGLLEEVLALDLRRAPSGLRFELERRLGTLRGDGA
jgi:HEAT repeat protein